MSHLSENLEGSMLSPSQKSKPRKRPSFGQCLDNENTPQDLIQHWSLLHKQPCVPAKGKENEEIPFVLAKRSRRRRESTGLSWNSLPDELLLGIFYCLPLQDLLRTSRVCKRWQRLVFDESLWDSVDLVGKAQVDVALPQVLAAGVLGLRCPRSCIGEPTFNTLCLRVQHLDLSNCTVRSSVLEDILSRCQQLLDLSLEGLELSDSILQSLSQNPKLVRLNLCGCSGFSPAAFSRVLQCCGRLEELNVSWCDFNSSHVKAAVDSMPSSVTQLNISGYRQNLTMEDVKVLVERCPNLTQLDLSDSVHVTANSFPALQKLACLRHLALSRCYQIHPASLADLEKFPKLQTLEVFGLIQDSYLPIVNKGLPRIQINTRCFSSVARPTPTNRTDRTMWGMRCRLSYRP